MPSMKNGNRTLSVSAEMKSATRLKKTANDHANQSRVDNSIIRHKAIKTPVSVIYHSIRQVNDRLREGRYFFADIKKEGRILYDSGKLKLERIRKPSPKKRKKIAEEDFNHWFKKAKDSCTAFKLTFEKKLFQEAAFELHQDLY